MRKRSRPLAPGATLALLAALVLAAPGCGTLWGRVRENERLFAVENARNYAKRGDCESMFDALDHGEARMDIGPFAKEATNMRYRCLERIGRTEAALAHRRLLDDFYGEQDPAYPKPDGSSIFRVRDLDARDLVPPPGALALASPHYSEFAARSRIIGRVVLSFELSSRDYPTKIRVLEMPHPLLATWAIEAVAKSRRDPKKKDAIIAPGERYVTFYVFESRHARYDADPTDDTGEMP